MLFEALIVSAIFFGWTCQVATHNALFRAFSAFDSETDKEKLEKYIDRCELISKISGFIALMSLVVALFSSMTS